MFVVGLMRMYVLQETLRYVGDNIWWREDFFQDMHRQIRTAPFTKETGKLHGKKATKSTFGKDADTQAMKLALDKFTEKYMAELMSESVLEQYNTFGTYPRPIVLKRFQEIRRE